MIRKRIIASGRVQGVCFRAFTMQKAKKLGIKGYAKNLMNGSVEIIACGEKDKINELIKFVRKGPALAKVLNLQIEDIPTEEIYQDFQIRYRFS